MINKDLMLKGKLYIAKDEDLGKDYRRAQDILQLINSAPFSEFQYKHNLFKELLGGTKDNFNIEPPFRCDYGINIFIGENFYANYECLILDINKVIIGDNVFFGPRVAIYTAGHPIDKEVRNKNLEFGKEVTIGNDVRIGGSSVILPGVHIGNNVVIGGGSVVTKGIPDNVIAFGNPCKVYPTITNEDKKYWEKLEQEYYLAIENSK